MKEVCRKCGGKVDAYERGLPYCATHALERAMADRKSQRLAA